MPPNTPVPPKERNVYREAFLNQYNLIFLLFFALASLILFIPWPLLVALGLEMVYMLFVPDSAFFRRYLDARYAAEAEAHRDAERARRLDELPGPQRERYDGLAKLVARTRSNLRKNQADAMYDAMGAKLDTLQQRFLNIMELANSYTNYLETVKGQDLDKLQRDLDKQLEQSTGRVRRVIQDRLDIVRKRKLRLEQVRENQLIVVNQIHTVEDTTRLIFEASLTMQNPEGLSQQLDDLIVDVEATAESVGDLRADDDALAREIEGLAEPLSDDLTSLPPAQAPAAQPAAAQTAAAGKSRKRR